MTTAEYINLKTDGVLTLVKETPTIADEATLGANEYFALMIYAEYQSYVRNYKDYKGSVNLNPRLNTYDLSIEKTSGEDGWYISKKYIKRHDLDRGRTIIVSVSDLTNCIILE